MKRNRSSDVTGRYRLAGIIKGHRWLCWHKHLTCTCTRWRHSMLKHCKDERERCSSFFETFHVTFTCSHRSGGWCWKRLASCWSCDTMKWLDTDRWDYFSIKIDGLCDDDNGENMPLWKQIWKCNKKSVPRVSRQTYYLQLWSQSAGLNLETTLCPVYICSAPSQTWSGLWCSHTEMKMIHTLLLRI